MEQKGELRRSGLPSLFRNFATENFTGVLTITSPVGEKLITLTECEVTIYCDELNESSRLGNILIAREKLTQEALEDTLRDQRKIEPRPMLGDMLVRRGQVTQQDCVDARRFQIEEDVCDILSWKNARFHFASRESAREIRPDDFAPDQVHRLAIDPESFFKSVAKFTDDWETIGDRLPTQYLCFKVSPKAEGQKDRLPANAQKILRQLSEGRTIEGAVKQSCLGRIEVCVQVIELLEQGLVVPASGAELRFQASEHRAQKHYHDALYIYRRLLESPDNKEELQYLENLAAEISAQIVALKQTGSFGEEAVVHSHRGAKEKFQSRSRFKKIALAAAVLLAVGLGGWAWIHSARISDDLPKQYERVLAASDQAMRLHDYAKAIAVMQDFNAGLKDKDSEVAQNVLEHLMRIPSVIDRDIKAQLPELETGINGGAADLSRSLTALRKFKQDNPNGGAVKKIDLLIALGEQKQKDALAPVKPVGPQVVETPRSELVERLKKAVELQQSAHYAEAERLFTDITRLTPANDSIWRESDEGLNSIQAVKLRAHEEFEKASAEFKANHGEKALELLSKIKSAYPDLEITAQATALEIRLQSRKRQAQELFIKARDEEALGKIYQALGTLVLLFETYPEFPIAAEAHTRHGELQSKLEAVRKKSLAAIDALKAGDYKLSRSGFRELLDKNYQLLVDQKVAVPVFVTSIPPGSNLKLNGENCGKTPQDVLVAAGQPFELIIERPGFKAFRIAKNNIASTDLEISVQLVLDPIVIDLKALLYAPAIAGVGGTMLMAGPDLVALNLPATEPVWSVKHLFNEKEAVPDGQAVVPGEEKSFWNCRLPPKQYLPGKLLLPLRNKDVLELDIGNPLSPVKNILLRKLPAEVVGRIYYEEHTRLAGKSLMVAAFADGQVRCFEDIDRPRGKAPLERWALPMDPSDKAGREPPVAGVHGYKHLVHVLTASGRLTAFDPVESHEAWFKQFEVMSSRAAFSEAPGDNLAALVQRNGKVVLFDLETQRPVWELPKRLAMQESVGVLLDETGVYVATANNDSGMIQMYQRKPDAEGNPVAAWAAALEGHVDLEMCRGKHLYLVTHLNKVFAFDVKTGRMRWGYKMEPELGRPLWIRTIGDYVYVGTFSGKLLVLKAD